MYPSKSEHAFGEDRDIGSPLSGPHPNHRSRLRPCPVLARSKVSRILCLVLCPTVLSSRHSETVLRVVGDVDEDTGSRDRDIQEQDVFMGDLPLMTDNGTFMVNGSERLVVSQMHRSPGVFFDHHSGKSHSSGKYLFSARVIPVRGSLSDLQLNSKYMLDLRIDRKRKLPVTTLLMALDRDKTEDKRAKAEKKGETLNPSDILGAIIPRRLNELDKVIEYSEYCPVAP